MKTDVLRRALTVLTSSASSPVSCSVSHPVSPPLLFPSLLHFIIFIVLLSCNREVPSRPSEAPVEVLSTRALTGATAVPPYPMPCCALHAWQGQDTLRQQGLSKQSQTRLSTHACIATQTVKHPGSSLRRLAPLSKDGTDPRSVACFKRGGTS